MQRASEQEARRPRVEPEVADEVLDLEPELGEDLVPALARPIVIGKRHPVPGVAHAVHEPQRWPGEPAVESVVLDQQTVPGDASRLAQQADGVVAVVQHVDEPVTPGMTQRIVRA